MKTSIDGMIDRLPERQRHEFALTCARRVQHIMQDPRSVAALDTRARWLCGEATNEEMNAAVVDADVAAWTATQYAARAASDAATAAADGDAPNAAAAARDAANAGWVAELAWQRAELKRMLQGGGA